MICALWAMVLGTEGQAQSLSDEALVTAAQRGDAQAFAALHRRYYTRIYRLAFLKTENAADAEDVAGETFLRALSHLPQFRFSALPGGGCSLYPWLHRIALNLIADSGRRRAPGGVTVSLDAEAAQGMRALLADTGASPHEVAERREVQQMVRDAIATLPADQSEILIYRYLGDLSLREIALLVRRSEPAAKSLLHRAVVALRTELARRLDGLDPRAIAQQYQNNCQGKETLDAQATVMAGRQRSD
jgi:RNA polymerase sigma-70 factor (ECF subfamily)